MPAVGPGRSQGGWRRGQARPAPAISSFAELGVVQAAHRCAGSREGRPEMALSRRDNPVLCCRGLAFRRMLRFRILRCPRALYAHVLAGRVPTPLPPPPLSSQSNDAPDGNCSGGAACGTNGCGISAAAAAAAQMPQRPHACEVVPPPGSDPCSCGYFSFQLAGAVAKLVDGDWKREAKPASACRAERCHISDARQVTSTPMHLLFIVGLPAPLPAWPCSPGPPGADRKVRVCARPPPAQPHLHPLPVRH